MGMGDFHLRAESNLYAKDYSVEELMDAIKSRSITFGKVVRCNKDNDLILHLGKNIRGIMKFDEVAYRDSAYNNRSVATSRVGKVTAFYVIGYDEEKDMFELSRNELQQDVVEYFKEKYTFGDVIDCEVIYTMNFGAFVDIGYGLTALIPRKYICTNTIVNMNEKMVPGMKIKAIVKEMCGSKVILSHRELLGTWEENAEQFEVGETVVGTIIVSKPYGIFVELAHNLAGIADYQPGYKVGDSVVVEIKKIDHSNYKFGTYIVGKSEIPRSQARFDYLYEGANIQDWVYCEGDEKREIRSVFDGSCIED